MYPTINSLSSYQSNRFSHPGNFCPSEISGTRGTLNRGESSLEEIAHRWSGSRFRSEDGIGHYVDYHFQAITEAAFIPVM